MHGIFFHHNLARSFQAEDGGAGRFEGYKIFRPEGVGTALCTLRLCSLFHDHLVWCRADDEVVQKLNANFSAETKKLDNEEHM